MSKRKTQIDKQIKKILQPQPKPNNKNNVHVWDLVIADMKARNEDGFRKYGVYLEPFNGRNSLIDAYQEVLDLAVYLRQCILEEEQG